MKLIVIDAQNAITVPELYDFEGFVANVKTLIGVARENVVEVIFIRHDDGAGSVMTPGCEGFEIYSGFSPAGGEKVFDKTVNSIFRSGEVTEYLRSSGETTLMVCGLQTDYCMDASVKCGFEHGFEMIVPAGANSTFDNGFMTAEESYRYYNEFMWNGRYAKCVSMDEALEMMRK